MEKQIGIVIEDGKCFLYGVDGSIIDISDKEIIAIELTGNFMNENYNWFVKTKGYRQRVRHSTLTAVFGGSNPPIPVSQ